MTASRVAHLGTKGVPRGGGTERVVEAIARRSSRNGLVTVYGRRGFLERIGAFDLRYALAADYDFFVRAVRCGRALHVAEPVSMFRMHKDSKSQNSRWRMWKETLAVSQELSGRRHLPLRARYALDRALYVVAPDRLVWRRSLIPVLQGLRRTWTRT